MRQPRPLLFASLCLLAACNTARTPGGDGASVPPPPAAEQALSALQSSPRHGEWVSVRTGAADSVRAYVVYPERKEQAPVVLVVHEIYGLTHWIRGVADQLAAAGYVAIAPDLLTGRDVPAEPTGDPVREAATREIRTLSPDDVHRRLRAVAQWGMALPAASDRYGIVGFCWGGAASFAHATRYPDLGAAVVYYGTSPETSTLAAIGAPVLGLYGSDDARVNATIPAADSAMKALGKRFEHHLYEGAGHGFLRQQGDRDGANLAATQQAWTETLTWFDRHLR